MNEKDLDWWVYHVLVAQPGAAPDDLARQAGCSPEEIHASLRRLEKAMLVECGPGGARALPVGEMLALCQARYDQSCPFVIEGGVIKARKPGNQE